MLTTAAVTSTNHKYYPKIILFISGRVKQRQELKMTYLLSGEMAQMIVNLALPPIESCSICVKDELL